MLKLQSKKRRQENAQATAEETRKRYLHNAEKFMQIDHKAMLSAFEQYRTLTGHLKDDFKINEARKSLENIIAAWNTWDLAKLTVEQQSILHHQYMANLPSAVKDLVADNNRDYFQQVADARLKTIYGFIANVLVEQALPSPPMLSRQLDPVSRIFPTTTVVNNAVTTRLGELEKMWRQAQQQAVTVEDRFFLDQLAASYLPDMWHMYTPFANADLKTKAQAADLILEQLALLRRGVQRILDDTRSVSLGELKAHKTFLSQRIQQDAQLTLPTG